MTGLGLALTVLLGLAIGIWLGLPGRDRQSAEDIEREMEKGGGKRRRRDKRSVNPLAWMQRKTQSKPSRDRRSSARKGFKLESPEDR
jgi:hypothetical protein